VAEVRVEHAHADAAVATLAACGREVHAALAARTDGSVWLTANERTPDGGVRRLLTVEVGRGE
jgi:predicted negative regulator of RcsB-dependent stress response